MLRFAVEDNGIGIPKDSLGGIFGKFSQADQATNKKYGGTGLGLAICKQLIQGMGGIIGVESEADKGALFWFEIPVKVYQEAVVPVQSEGLEALFSKRILVVDDSRISRDIIGFGFNIWGLEHTLVASGAEALDALAEGCKEEKPYDIALIDFDMPEMNGEELAQIIRDDISLYNTKLILITTLGKYKGFDFLKTAGFDDYILKPIYPEDLMEILLHVSATPSNVTTDDNRERSYA